MTSSKPDLDTKTKAWFNGGMETNRTEFTTAAFERSHGRRPSGRGSWAFQAATNWTAFDRDLTGEIVWANGTLTEAKAAARIALPGQLIAVLP